MPLDLSALKFDSDKPIIPREIFTTLGSHKFARLRVEQNQVLGEWYERRSERDLVIKQNTGGGKTLIGLLIAQSSLNEGVSPVVYAVPDTYLVKQVVVEAEALGINITKDAKDSDFLAGNSVLICTIDKVMNGRTVFGLVGNPNAVRVGTFIVDDAHAALSSVQKQFTFEASSQSAVYKKALQVFSSDLEEQNFANAKDIIDGDPAATPMRIPFWSWREKYPHIFEDLADLGKDNTEGTSYFSWPLIKGEIKHAIPTISGQGIQLRLPLPNIDKIPAFSHSQRRVYLTATLADDGVLVSEFNADASSIEKPITPEYASDIGDRLILAPLTLDTTLTDASIRMLVESFANGDFDGDQEPEEAPINVVVLVPSDRVAKKWKPYADHILHVSDMGSPLAELANGDHLGIVVLVNKYDGVDLPGSACRLLVIDGIPTPLDMGDQRKFGAIVGSREFQIRQTQKIEQGLGRGVRDEHDYCAVLLMGNEAALSVYQKKTKNYIQLQLKHS